MVNDWEGEPSRTDIARVTKPLIVTAHMQVVVLSGPDQGKRLDLEPGLYTIGKASGCALVMSDGQVSRQHLEIKVAPEGITVRDLNSTNGSFFGGARFSEVTIGAGAVVTIGASELKFSPPLRTHSILPSQADHFGQLYGRSLRMREVFAVLELVAQSDVAVLIQGETGTGKELCAEAIARSGPRAKAPFVVCDLAGISRTLIESELFGHLRGSFTGADRDRDGAFTQAHKGTIFIDEVGELEIEQQPRLLRAIAQRKVKPVGAGHYRDVDVRMIAATNRDLREEVKAGRFREDLYHRLAVVELRLPPLRERKEDVPFLVERFLQQMPGGPGVTIPPETMALLSDYDWPGNVRELRNVVERGLSLMGSSRVFAPQLLGVAQPSEPAPVPTVEAQAQKESVGADVIAGLAEPDGTEGFRQAKERLISTWERTYVAQLLRRAGGNVSRAARQGGLDRVYLHRLIKKHAIAVPESAVTEDESGGE